NIAAPVTRSRASSDRSTPGDRSEPVPFARADASFHTSRVGIRVRAWQAGKHSHDRRGRHDAELDDGRAELTLESDQLDDAAKPPAGSPEAPPPAAPAATDKRFRWRRWMSVLAAIAVLILLLGVVGRAVRLPYYTIAPGSALDLVGGGDASSSRIAIHGAKTYPTD